MHYTTILIPPTVLLQQAGLLVLDKIYEMENSHNNELLVIVGESSKQ